MKLGDDTVKKIRRFFVETTDPGSDAVQDERLSQIAVARRLVSGADLEKCREEQNRLRASGEDVRLAKILLDRGHLSADDFEELVLLQGSHLQACPKCDRVYDVSGHTGAVRLRCLKCGEELTEVQTRDQLEKSYTPYTIKKDTAESTRMQLGRYTLIREIARGGMGVVFEAEDPNLKRRVALKILREGEAGPQHVTRLHREAAIAAQLRHPNIVGIYEVGMIRDAADHPTHFIAMDYVDGRTLADVIEEGKTGRAEMVRMLEEVARAVAFAHEKGVVHRDLKPANVLVDKTGRVFLTDFGLAHAEIFEAKLTRSQTVMGTPHYMAPEQVAGRTREIGPVTDVYALGALLYEIIVGRPPFTAPTLAALYNKILHHEPLRPSRLGKPAEHDLELICFKAMEKEIPRRYPRALEFAEDLARFRAGEPIHARPPSVFYRVRKVMKKKWAMVTAGVAILAVGAGVAFFMREREFRQAEAEARTGFRAGEWERAGAAARRANEIHGREELRRIIAESERRIQEREIRRRLDERVRPLDRLVRDTRQFFYMKVVDIKGKLAVLEEGLHDLESLMTDPAHRDYGPGWRTLGIGWYFVGNVPRAERFLLEAKARMPDDAWVVLHLGKIYLERSFIELIANGFDSLRAREERSRSWSEKALPFLRRPGSTWEGVQPVDRHLALAYRAAAGGHSAEVLRLCEEGIRRYGREMGAEEYFLLRARFLPDPKSKRKAYGGAIDARPHYALAFLLRGDTYSTRESRSARSDYTRAVAINRRLAMAFNNRGRLDHDRGNYKDAADDYTRAIGIDPGFALAYLNRALARLNLRQVDAALEDCGKALQVSPGFVEVYVARGSIHYERQRWRDAESDFSRAISGDPRAGRAYFGRGMARLRLKENDAAFGDFSTVIDLDPENKFGYLVQALTNRGMIHALRGRHKESQADIDRALRLQKKIENRLQDRSED